MVKSGRVQNLGGVTYEKVDKRGSLNITAPKKGKEEMGGGGERESQILEADNIVVCAGNDIKNNLEITLRGGRRVVDGRRRRRRIRSCTR